MLLWAGPAGRRGVDVDVGAGVDGGPAGAPLSADPTPALPLTAGDEDAAEVGSDSDDGAAVVDIPNRMLLYRWLRTLHHVLVLPRSDCLAEKSEKDKHMNVNAN